MAIALEEIRPPDHGAEDEAGIQPVLHDVAHVRHERALDTSVVLFEHHLPDRARADQIGLRPRLDADGVTADVLGKREHLALVVHDLLHVLQLLDLRVEPVFLLGQQAAQTLGTAVAHIVLNLGELQPHLAQQPYHDERVELARRIVAVVVLPDVVGREDALLIVVVQRPLVDAAELCELPGLEVETAFHTSCPP